MREDNKKAPYINRKMMRLLNGFNQNKNNINEIVDCFKEEQLLLALKDAKKQGVYYPLILTNEKKVALPVFTFKTELYDLYNKIEGYNLYVCDVKEIVDLYYVLENQHGEMDLVINPFSSVGLEFHKKMMDIIKTEIK